jgi:hypothetical protein
LTEPPQSPAALVVSYTTVSPLPRLTPGRSAFCGTVPRVTPGRRYRPPCPVEPGPSSPGLRPARPPVQNVDVLCVCNSHLFSGLAPFFIDPRVVYRIASPSWTGFSPSMTLRSWETCTARDPTMDPLDYNSLVRPFASDSSTMRTSTQCSSPVKKNSPGSVFLTSHCMNTHLACADTPSLQS